MSSYLIACGYSGRGCSGAFETETELKSHLGTCFYRSIECPQCFEKEIYRNLRDHMGNSCKNRIVSCDTCPLEMFFCELEPHRQTCPERIITCKFCTSSIVAKNLDYHLEICEVKPRECSLKLFGCAYTAPKKEITKHQKDVNLHFEPLCVFVKEGISDIERRFDERAVMQTNLEEELNHIKGRCESLEISTRALQNLVKEVAENVLTIGETNKKLTEDCNGVMEILTQHDIEVKNLHLVKAEVLKMLYEKVKTFREIGESIESLKEESRASRESISCLEASIKDFNTFKPTSDQEYSLIENCLPLEEKVRQQSQEINNLKEVVQKLLLEMKIQNKEISKNDLEPKSIEENVDSQLKQVQELPRPQLSLNHGCHYFPPITTTLGDITETLLASLIATKEITIVFTELSLKESFVSKEIDDVFFDGKSYKCFLTQCKGLERCHVGLQLVRTIAKETAPKSDDEREEVMVQAMWCILDSDIPENVRYCHIIDGTYSERKDHIWFAQFAIDFLQLKDTMPNFYAELAEGNCKTAFLICKKSGVVLEENCSSNQENEPSSSMPIPLPRGQGDSRENSDESNKNASSEG